MGNHTNLRGIAVFEIVFSENGHVVKAEAISGHPLGLHLLLAALEKWQFKPYVQNGVAREACGRLKVKFSIVENVPFAEVLKPTSS